MRRTLLHAPPVPPRANLVGWYRCGQGVTSASGRVSSWANAYGAAPSLDQATAANQPIDLPYNGQNYLYMPGVTGNYASTPSAAANRITGDLDLRLCLAADTWTPSGNCGLIAKEGAAGDIAYTFYLNTAGKLGFYYTNDGSSTSGRATASSVAVGFANRATGWVRVTYASATGKTNFFTSTDGATWAALGTEQTLTAGAIFDSATKTLEIGTLNGGTLPMAGKIYRAQVMSGINGTVAQDFNPAAAADSAGSVVAATGETWTINATGTKPGQIVGIPSLLFDGAAYFLKTAAFTLNQPVTVYLLFRQVSWTANEPIYDGNVTNACVLYQATATPRLTQYAGADGATTTGVAVNTWVALASVWSGAASSLQINLNAATTGNPGTAGMAGFTLGRYGSAANPDYGHIQVREILLYNAAHDAATRTRVNGYLARIGGLSV